MTSCDSCDNPASWISSLGQSVCDQCKQDYEGSEEQTMDEVKSGEPTVWQKITQPNQVPPNWIKLEEQTNEPINEPTLDPIVLRQVQSEAVEAYIKSGTNDNKKASLLLPVASGKTIVALKIREELGKLMGRELATLIVVPRIVLIQNPWMKEMNERFGINPETVGQFYSEHKELHLPISITLYPSFAEHPEIVKNFDMVVFDEAQFLGEADGQSLLKNPDVLNRKYLLGMTGTLEKTFKNDPTRAVMPVVYERTIAEVRQHKILADATIENIPINLTPWEMQEYNYLTADYNRKMDNHQDRWAMISLRKRTTLLSCAQNKIDPIIKLLSQSSEPTLIFSESIDSIVELQNRLTDVGIKSEVLTAKINRKARQKIIDGFGTVYQNLLSVGTIEVGFNVPHASREIIFGSGTTQTKIEQRIGRVLRVNPDDPNKLAKIYVVWASNTVESSIVSKVMKAYTRLREEYFKFDNKANELSRTERK